MKRLVVCCDGISTQIQLNKGTGQDADGETLQSPSNVCLLSRAVQPIAQKTEIDSDYLKVDQIVYYQAGVGTQFGRLTRLWGDATGAGLKQNVREAYGFICHNWHEGDEIYLFGFSRGAYTARAIAGLISLFGLLTSRTLNTLGTLSSYSFDLPTKPPFSIATLSSMTYISDYHALIRVLNDQDTFKELWGPAIQDLTGTMYMLGSDTPEAANQHVRLDKEIFKVNGSSKAIWDYFETITNDLIVRKSYPVEQSIMEMDVVREYSFFLNIKLIKYCKYRICQIFCKTFRITS
jgi:Uncharacterized alpha/beta hydrolase domain (DUF2235)